MNDEDSSSLRGRLVTFVPNLFLYLKFRFRQIYIWSLLVFEFCFSLFADLKKEMVKRLFWGRTSFYRSFFHLVIVAITFATVVGGVTQRFVSGGYNYEQAKKIASGGIGFNDMSLQYANAKTFTVKDANTLPFDLHEHTVEKDETLESIAEKYKIGDTASIKWANSLDPYSNKVYEGQILKIPPMKGVLRQVSSGDTLDSVLKSISNADKITVIELNNLKESDDFALSPDSWLFIPNGEIPLPVRVSSSGGSSGGSPNVLDLGATAIDVPAGTFVSPVGDSSCSGVSVSRGYSTYHTGVDLAKKDGCWIRAVAEGTVERARWCAGGLGYCTVIKHPNGFTSLYAHGNGDFAVQEGEYVGAGQLVMYMGNTGFSFGTHLHFSIAQSDDVISYRSRINPKGIVPYP
jgi:murein DD-endopeptidase MepM/ murein hydrolase activator NlpD